MALPQIHSIELPTKFGHLKSFHFYIVRSAGKVFLIDAGVDSEACWINFTNRLEELKLEITDVDAIILTHHHADHIGLVNRIREVHDVAVFAHPKAFHYLRRDAEALQERMTFFENLYKKMGCGEEVNGEIDRLRKSVLKNKSQAVKGELSPIKAGDNFNGFSILETPGHASDHIVLFDEKSGSLFGGDMVIEHISTNALIERGMNGERTQSLLAYEQSLLKLRDSPVEIVYPGHGEVIQNPQAVINKKINRIKQKGERVLSYMIKRHTAAEIAQKMYRSRYETLFPLVMSEVIGHLDRLVNLEKLVAEVREGVIYYTGVE